MGWDGSTGLGSENEGRNDLIDVEFRIGRGGIGSQSAIMVPIINGNQNVNTNAKKKGKKK
jgi:hypothetical protein